MKAFSIPALLLALALLSACNDGSGKSLQATREHDGQTLSLARGKTLLVHLDGNPTTGYEWSVAHNLPERLELRHVDYRPGSSLPGAGGTYVFQFRALAPGPVPLRLQYRRAWESRPIDTFSLDVLIPE